METLYILYTSLGVVAIIGLLCGECVFKVCDEYQQRKQSLRDQIWREQLTPRSIDLTTPEPSLIV